VTARLSEVQIEQQRRVQTAGRWTCATPGPWGYVCTLDRNHSFSCYDGSKDSPFNHHWIDDWDVPPEFHFYDCACKEH
jgi:hypothetical protein